MSAPLDVADETSAAEGRSEELRPDLGTGPGGGSEFSVWTLVWNTSERLLRVMRTHGLAVLDVCGRAGRLGRASAGGSGLWSDVGVSRRALDVRSVVQM